MKQLLYKIFLPLVILGGGISLVAQTPEPAKTETPKKKDEKIKPYAEVITAQAQSDAGLFTYHKVGDKHYFELPFSLLERELLIVSRISGHVRNLNFGGAGMSSRPEQVVRWQRKDGMALLRSVSYNSVASEDEPIYRSVRNNNFEPVIMAFDIAAFNKDSSALVIEVSPLFNTDVEMIGPLSSEERKTYEIKALDSKRSFVERVKSFPENVEVRHVLTYSGGKLPDNAITGTLSVEMNQSFILLPAQPMQPRYYDGRVGYFSVQQTDYSSDEQKAAKRRFITRWRLEPKDPAAFARGQLTEPVKPIIYYIDPATPEKWRPYIKQGINDWQTAFEKIGFKNAIMAKDPPSPQEDPDWSPEDVRYSCVRYITTEIQNAVGPHVHDPRTGEIIESDILWYHNVMNLLRNWFFIQTAAVNPEAQKMKFSDELMGQLIRFVAAHEVGHTLGLPHNMGSSSAYPVDSLRAPGFVQRMGVAPSIMDYARFNYVAQPTDKGAGLMPKIGPYDDWSIEYGYKPVAGKNAESERATLHEWVKAKAGNPIYHYGRQHFPIEDPGAQTEDVGSDPVRASDLGIANLKRITKNLVQWTSTPGEDYNDLEEMYGQVVGQYLRYMNHVAANVGGVYEHRKTSDEAGVVYQPVPRDRQAKAVGFLSAQLFQTPAWLIDNNILQRIEAQGIFDRLRNAQVNTLNNLMETSRLNRLNEAVVLLGAEAYAPRQLFDDLRQLIWREAYSHLDVDPFRRNLQRAHAQKLMELAQGPVGEARSLSLMTLKKLRRPLKGAWKRADDPAVKAHFWDMWRQVRRVVRS